MNRSTMNQASKKKTRTYDEEFERLMKKLQLYETIQPNKKEMKKVAIKLIKLLTNEMENVVDDANVKEFLTWLLQELKKKISAETE